MLCGRRDNYLTSHLKRDVWWYIHVNLVSATAHTITNCLLTHTHIPMKFLTDLIYFTEVPRISIHHWLLVSELRNWRDITDSSVSTSYLQGFFSKYIHWIRGCGWGIRNQWHLFLGLSDTHLVRKIEMGLLVSVEIWSLTYSSRVNLVHLCVPKSIEMVVFLEFVIYIHNVFFIKLW